jgi:hypothetical protein
VATQSIAMKITPLSAANLDCGKSHGSVQIDQERIPDSLLDARSVAALCGIGFYRAEKL